MDQRFVGAWELGETVVEEADGTVVGPLFQGWTGQIMYTADGHMGVHMMAPAHRDAPTKTAAEMSADDKAAAFEGFIAYYGSYEVDDAVGVVTHHVAGGSRPGMAGADFPRHFQLTPDALILSPPVGADGRRSFLTWNKVRS